MGTGRRPQLVKRTYLVDTLLFKYIELLPTIDSKNNSLVLRKLRELEKQLRDVYIEVRQESARRRVEKLTKGLVISLPSKRKTWNKKLLLNQVVNSKGEEIVNIVLL
jgi:hypothetical protein